jgi:hypothetical protein
MGSKAPVYATQTDDEERIEYEITVRITETVEETYDDVDSRDEAVLNLKQSIDGISTDEPFKRVSIDGVRPPFHVTAVVERTTTVAVEARDAIHATDVARKEVVRTREVQRGAVTPMEVVRR